VAWKTVPGLCAGLAVLSIALAAWLKMSDTPLLPPVGVAPRGLVEFAGVCLLFGINWSLARGPGRE